MQPFAQKRVFVAHVTKSTEFHPVMLSSDDMGSFSNQCAEKFGVTGWLRFELEGGIRVSGLHEVRSDDKLIAFPL